MKYIVKKIELPQENGVYILTAEAVKIIRKAKDLHVNFELINRERVEENCWLRAGIKQKLGREQVIIAFEMPINICGINWHFADWKFTSLEDVRIGVREDLHPILGLVKKGAAIYFEPYPGAHTTDLLAKHNLIGDALFWEMKVGTKRYQGLFTSRISEQYSSYKLIKNTKNKYCSEGHNK